MREKFSTRFGIARPSKLVDDQIPNDLRVRLWNIFQLTYLNYVTSGYDDGVRNFGAKFLMEFSLETVREIPSSKNSLIDYLYNWFFKAKWYSIYDFLEFIAAYPNQIGYNETYNVIAKAREFEGAINRALYEGGVAFALKNGEIVKRLGELEYSEIEAVLDLPEKYKLVSTHIQKAYDFFVSRNPDYKNSVKEAVSAIESLLKTSTGIEKGKMGELWAEYTRSNPLHSALKTSLSNLFGFASDSGGVRHGSSENSDVSEETARLILMISVSACNFLAHSSKEN